MAKKIIINAKTRRTSICGALETLLINENLIRMENNNYVFNCIWL